MIFQDLKFIKALNKFSWFYLVAINLNWFTSILLAFNDFRGHSSLISQNGVPALKLVEIAIVPISGGVTRCVNLGAKLLVVVRMKIVDWLQPKCRHWSGINSAWITIPFPEPLLPLSRYRRLLNNPNPEPENSGSSWITVRAGTVLWLFMSYQTALRNGSI